MKTTFSDPKADHLWTHARIGLAFVGTDGDFLRVNPYLAELLGYTVRELEGRSFRELSHPDDVGADEQMIEAVLAGRLPWYTMTKRYLPKVGSPIWIRLHVSRVRSADGSIGFFLSQIRPVDREVLDRGRAQAKYVAPPTTVDDVGKFLRAHWKAIVTVGGVIGAAVAKALRLW